MPSGVNETRRESFVNWHLFETEGVQARLTGGARVKLGRKSDSAKGAERFWLICRSGLSVKTPPKTIYRFGPFAVDPSAANF